MPRAAPLLIVLAVLSAALLPGAAADWDGDADLRTLSVKVNFSERFAVVITNDGPGSVEVLSVAVTINWENMPTLYRVFEGSAVLAPGESREFASPPTRMPNVVPGTYSCFVGVVARGPDGVAVEHRFPSTIEAEQFSMAVAGLPEEALVPAVVTALSLAVTALLFRWERTPGWPFLRAVPRWGRYQYRRT